MTIKKFIMSGLALGTMLMASTSAHASDLPFTNLGTLSNLGVKSKQVTTTNGELKVFKFTHAACCPDPNTCELNLGTVNVTQGKNLSISLYEDTDQDGKLNLDVGHDKFLLSSIAGGQNNTDRKIFSRQKPGTYFALVNPKDGSSITFDFLASSTGGNESNLLAASAVVEALNTTFKLFPLDDKKSSDFYKFILPAGKNVSMTMTPTGGQAQMRVIQDVGSDHAVVLGTETVQSSPASTRARTITISNPANKPFTYYLQVSQSVPGQKVATEVKFNP